MEAMTKMDLTSLNKDTVIRDIHFSAKFGNSEFKHHKILNFKNTVREIEKNKDTIISIGIGQFKEYCKNTEIDFQTMTYFEAYFFDENSNEYQIFEKVKST